MIAVTGIGIVSAYGIGKEIFLSSAIKGPGIGEYENPDKKNGIMKGGFVRVFTPKKYIPVMKLRKMSRYSRLALVSAIEAWKDSLIQGQYDPSHIGVIVGTGLGSVSSTDSFYEGLLERGPEETNPILFPETVQNIASAHISIEFGLIGPNTTFSQAAAAGEYAINYACELLKDGIADAVLVNGADELTDPLFEGMKALRIFSKSDMVRPFDIRRDGLLPGEGACTLVLERIEDAKKRNARIYGYIESFGFSTEPVDRLKYSSSDAMSAAMREAMKDYKPDLIVSSANSSLELDLKEALAIRDTVGENVPVTSITSMTGFFMSSGVMKTAAAMLFGEQGVIPPIWGLEEPEMRGLDYVIETRQMNVKTVLINGFSHGGSNACILLKGRDET